MGQDHGSILWVDVKIHLDSSILGSRCTEDCSQTAQIGKNSRIVADNYIKKNIQKMALKSESDWNV